MIVHEMDKGSQVLASDWHREFTQAISEVYDLQMVIYLATVYIQLLTHRLFKHRCYLTYYIHVSYPRHYALTDIEACFKALSSSCCETSAMSRALQAMIPSGRTKAAPLELKPKS